MKKCLIALASVMLIITTSLALAGCSPEEQLAINNNVGNKMPTATPAKAVNDGMSAYDMYLAVLENHKAAPYVGSYQGGDVITKTMGMTTSQGLEVRKVRKGDVYYMDNYTATKKAIAGINIRLMEETVIEKGNIRYRVSDGCSINDNNELVAKKWKPTDNFDTVEDLLAERPNDPTRLFMYIVNQDTIVSSTAPEYDRKTKQYTFKLVLDPKTANKNYEPVVKQQLEGNGFKNATLNFTTTELEFTVWQNGFIRSINIREAYSFKSSLSATANLDALVNFTYDESEMPLSKLIRF